MTKNITANIKGLLVTSRIKVFNSSALAKKRLIYISKYDKENWQ